MQSQTPNPPQPTLLASLNASITPFHDRPRALNLIITYYEYLLGIAWDHHEMLAGQPLPRALYPRQFYTHWHRFTNEMARPMSFDFLDPESLQVSQSFKGLDKDAAYEELWSHLGKIGGGPRDIMYDVPWTQFGGYTQVTRGRTWLVSCVVEHFPDLPPQTKDAMLKLTFVQPFAYHDLLEDAGMRDRGLMPALEGFVQASDWQSVIHILTFCLKQAMTVADIWAMCPPCDREFPTNMPNYKYFITGFRWAHRNYVQEIKNPFSELPFTVRNELKGVSFIQLWETLWYWAKTASSDSPNVAFPIDRQTLRTRMYDFLIEAMTAQPICNIKERRPILVEFRLHDSTGRYPRRQQMIDADSYLNTTIFDGVLEPKYMICDVGKQFYGHSVSLAPEGYSFADEDRELEALLRAEPVEFEAVGARHYVRDFAKEVDEIPDEGLCTICMEEFSLQSSDAKRCIRLNVCKHLLHAYCADGWVNGVAQNSNTCPECRTTIVEERRALEVGVDMEM